MEYKRSKSLYLSILAGVALLAGIAHQNHDHKLISVQVNDQNPNTSVWVAKINQSTNQNLIENEEADSNTALVID